MLILSLFSIRNLFRLIYYFSLLPVLIDLVNKDYHLLTLTICGLIALRTLLPLPPPPVLSLPKFTCSLQAYGPITSCHRLCIELWDLCAATAATRVVTGGA